MAFYKKLINLFILIFLCFCTVCDYSLASVSTNALTIPLSPLLPIYSNLESIPQTIPASKDNIYTNLKVPTQITKIDNLYFIVDCYHNQIIYNDNLTDPIIEWKVLTKDVNQPHTIASDGVLYLIDDTENNRLLAFEKNGNRFVHTQTFTSVGNRPHYIVYDPSTSTFYAWSSLTGEMYLIKREQATNRLYISEVKQIPELYGQYVRSFLLTENDIYFPSGNNSLIIQADKNTLEIKTRYPVPPEYAGMVQLTRIQDYFYITVSTDVHLNQNTATLLRVKSLEDLSTQSIETVYSYFSTTGTPYYISTFENTYFLTHHRTSPGIWGFKVNNNKIEHVQKYY